MKTIRKRWVVMTHVFAAALMVACNSSNSFDKNLDLGGDSQWLSDIQSCIKGLDPKQNSYVFGDNQLDCSAGTAALDCSGFINNVAQAYFPQAYKDLTTDGPRPTVATYYHLISNAKADSPITPVDSMDDLVAGDIIMWIYVGEQRIKIGASGHMMLVLAPPVSVGTNVYRVYVADSAESGHYEDTRGPGQKGLGMGYIYFKTNAEDFPIRYSWENATSWQPYSPIQLGHLVD